MRSAVRLPVLGAVVVLLLVSAAGAHALPQPPEPRFETPGIPPAPEDVTAESWVLLDAVSGQILAEHHASQRRPVASTIKILTALSVVERTAPGELVTVGEEVEGLGGALVGLRPGDVRPVSWLVDTLIVHSGNDAAEALAVHVAGSRRAFVEMMRSDARQLGLDVTIGDPSGLDDVNLLSARDLAVLGAVALRSDELREHLGRREVELADGRIERTRNELLETYAGATGIKTGYTRQAGNALVGSAMRGDRELVAVVLGAGDDPARFDDAAELLDHGFATTTLHRLEPHVELRVGGGTARYVGGEAVLTAAAGAQVRIDVTVPATAPHSVELAVSVDDLRVGELHAPLAEAPRPARSTGERIGRAAADAAWAAIRASGNGSALR